jgi:hypothetical protein
MSKLRSLKLKRRHFVSTAIASAGAFSLLPISGVLAADQRKLIWTGINFMQASGNKELTPIPKYFPNIYPSLEDKKTNKVLYNKIPGEWGATVGKSATHKIVWVTEDTNTANIAEEADLGIMVAVSSDRAIGQKYYSQFNYTILVYEVQTYLFIFDIEKFEIIQSYPIRIWSYDVAEGKASEDALQSRMLTSLGGRPSQKGQINLPTILQNKLREIDLKDQKSVNLRVTTVQSKGMTKKWVTQADQKMADFHAIVGNSLTNAVSEQLKIPIQPFAPNGALFKLTTTFMGASGGRRDTSYADKLMNAAPIDIEIRALSKGIKVKKTPRPGSDTLFTNKIVMMVEIQVGRWEKTDGKEPQLKELIFKQNLMAISREITTGIFLNDWYYVLDLHQRMFDWFFAEIGKGTDYPKISRGQRDKYKSREFLTRIKTKDYPKFELEAQALRAALLR